jgi:hypothetical protein
VTISERSAFVSGLLFGVFACAVMAFMVTAYLVVTR